MLRTVVAAVSLWLALPLSGCVHVPIPVGGLGKIKTEGVAKGASLMLGARLLANKLAKIEAEFQKRRQKLTVVSAGTESEAYRAKEVESLVDSTEEDVLDALDGKEWAALRDSVRLRFHRVHQDLETSAQTSRLPEPASAVRVGIRLAAFGLNKTGLGGLRRTLVDPILERAGALIQAVKSRFAEKRLTLRLCVVSRPAPEASIHMWPPSYKKGGFGGETIREFPQAPIGRYSYKIQYKQRNLKKQFEPIECGGGKGSEYEPCLDFMDSTEDQLIECNFEAGTCGARNLPAGKCPPQ